MVSFAKEPEPQVARVEKDNLEELERRIWQRKDKDLEAMENRIIERITQLIKREGLMSGPQPSAVSTGRRASSPSPTRGACFNCGEEGHFRNACPKLSRPASPNVSNQENSKRVM